MQKEKLLRVEEVALLIGVSSHTINNWYLFKRQNPDHEQAKILPEFKQSSNRQTRYWAESDLWKLIEFKSKMPKGRNGFMGGIRANGKSKSGNIDSAVCSK